jgi:hypothetical protein
VDKGGTSLLSEASLMPHLHLDVTTTPRPRPASSRTSSMYSPCSLSTAAPRRPLPMVRPSTSVTGIRPANVPAV